MKELKETVDLMCSKDYKKRFKAEYYQLKIRFEKLFKMCSDWDEDKLDFIPTCDRELYTEQLIAMHDYLDCLEARAEEEGVEL